MNSYHHQVEFTCILSAVSKNEAMSMHEMRMCLYVCVCLCGM